MTRWFQIPSDGGEVEGFDDASQLPVETPGKGGPRKDGKEQTQVGLLSKAGGLLTALPSRTSFCPLERDVVSRQTKGQEKKQTRAAAAAKRNLLFFLADPALAPVFKSTWEGHKWAFPSVVDVLTSHPLGYDVMVGDFANPGLYTLFVPLN